MWTDPDRYSSDRSETAAAAFALANDIEGGRIAPTAKLSKPRFLGCCCQPKWCNSHSAGRAWLGASAGLWRAWIILYLARTTDT